MPDNITGVHMPDNITPGRLREILSLHRQWRVSGGKEGAGANLAGANLAGANLAGANLAGANLAGANLAGADLLHVNLAYVNLAGANLAGANLAGADLADAKGILRLGPIDGWEMHAVRWEDGPRIHAGCRWFTVGEAREHWGVGCADRRGHGDRMLAGLDALVVVAKANGWPV